MGTVAHAKALCARMRQSALAQLYESLDFIVGSEWSGSDSDREAFVARLKSYDRSIIVNVDVMTEGYDDPRVNTVVMAKPTRSKLVYMQAAGRCVRSGQDEEPTKRAFIVEVADELPNIRYRIDNRWLFSEISDALEPAVEDRFYASEEEFVQQVKEIYGLYNVADEHRLPIEWNQKCRYGMLLFRSYAGTDESGQAIYRHIPIVMDSYNRPAVTNWFNFLSERMAKFDRLNLHHDEGMRGARFGQIASLSDPVVRQLVFESMLEASRVITRDDDPEQISAPWVTYVAFRYQRSQLTEELLSFTEDMVNRDQIRGKLLARAYQPPAGLVKLPLPLASAIGAILTEQELVELEQLLNDLRSIRDDSQDRDHRAEVRAILANVVMPLPPGSIALLPTIVRENSPYCLKLD